MISSPPTKHAATAGFSLVEVVMAIGIFAFAITLVFGLLPVGIQSVRQSVAEVEATQLMERVEQDVRNGHGTTGTASMLYGIPITTAGTNTLFFDRNFVKVDPTSDSRFYRIECRIAPVTNGLNVDLRATWPALASAANAEGSSGIATFVFTP